MGKYAYFGVAVDKELLEKFRKAVRKNYEEGKIRRIIEAAMRMYIEHEEIAFPPPKESKKKKEKIYK